MKNLFRVPILLFLIIITSVLLNLVAMGVFVLSNFQNEEYIHIRIYSENITTLDGKYHIGEEIKNEIDARNLFAFIIAPDGSVLWEYNKPADIADNFTLNEIASFSRWYLNGYPVSVWARDDGLLVLGSLPKTLWKYNITMQMSQMKMLIWLVPLVLILNFIIIFYLCYKMTKKWQRERDLARTEWVAAVSHDIRTPLSMVLGYSDSLKNDATLSEEHQSKLHIIAHQSETIKKSLEDINLVNRLDYSEGVSINDKFSVSKIIREVIAEKINSGLNDNYKFILELTEPLALNGDDSLFKRLIDNIISNSIKHNPNGTDITIKAEKKKKRLIIEISDSGCGFESIEQANKKSQKDFAFYEDKHSLGLVIIKKIVIRFHGKVIFSNDNGAKVTIEI